MTEWIKAIDPQVLDFWKAAGTVLVAMVAAAIAGMIQYRQWRTAQDMRNIAHDKLRLDLFERRMEFYSAVYEIAHAVYEGGEKTVTIDLNKMLEHRKLADWLFGKDIEGYLEGMTKAISNLVRLTETRHVNMAMNPILRREIEEKHTRFEVLHREFKVSDPEKRRAAFAPYLGFDSVFNNARFTAAKKIA